MADDTSRALSPAMRERIEAVRDSDCRRLSISEVISGLIASQRYLAEGLLALADELAQREDPHTNPPEGAHTR